MRFPKTGLAAAILCALLAACESLPAPTEPPFTGTWRGQLPAGGAMIPVTLQLHERAGGRQFAYALGGGGVVGAMSGGRFVDGMVVVFTINDASGPQQVVLSGAVAGDVMTGEAFIGSSSSPAIWGRDTGVFEERQFVFADAGDGAGMEFDVVTDAAGAFSSGAFSAFEGCGSFGCRGLVTSFAEDAGGNVVIGLRTLDACPATGSLSATFDPGSRFYSGSWMLTDDAICGGATRSGALIGGRGMMTDTADAAAVLALFGGLADDVETADRGGSALPASYAAISSAYRHFGEDRAGLVARFNDDIGAYEGLRIEFDSFSKLKTQAQPDANPLLESGLGVRFRDLRYGSATPGAPRALYRETPADTPTEAHLRFLANEAGRWRFIGNQVGEFDLPFAYAIGAEHLLAPSRPGATPLYVHLGGWGAHFPPLTGHLEGNGKADLFGSYARSPADLAELQNSPLGTAGVCDIQLAYRDDREVCGFWGGPAGDIIRDRIFRYTAPYDGTVRQVTLEQRPRPAGASEPGYFDNVPHWSVRIEFDGGIVIDFVHLGRLTGAVRSGLLATGIDPDLYVPSSAPGDADYCPPWPGRCNVELLAEGDAFPIAAGDEIAEAQTDASPVPGHPGYFRARIGPSISPWAQIEFFVTVENGAEQSAATCAYALLPRAKRQAMAAVLTADMLNPASLRYEENDFKRPWKYRAEAALCNGGDYFYRDASDFSSLHGQLGGWYERAEPGTTPDEQFSIIPIQKGAAAYDPSLYDVKRGTTEPVDYLVGRDRAGGPYRWTIPGLGVRDVWYPAGEVLDLTHAEMTIKWRELTGPPGISLYQRAAFELDPASGLKVKWGPLSPSLAGAIAPVLAPGEACNDTTVLCYNRTRP